MVNNTATVGSDQKTKPGGDDGTSKKELIRATQLPIHGNPYPPKDVIDVHQPGFLERKIGQFRITMQPYTAPFKSAIERTNEVLTIGASHTQTSLQRLADSQNAFVSALVIAGSGLISLAMLRRRGLLTKFLVTSTITAGAAAACYPKEAEEQAKLLVYIAKNKLPTFARGQYEKLASYATTRTSTNPDSSSSSSDTKP